MSWLDSRISRWQDSAKRARAGINAAKPPVRIETERSAPDWVFRAACLVFGVLAIIALHSGIVLIVIMSAMLALVLFRPSAGTAAVFCATVGLSWLIEPSAPNGVAQILVLALVPAVWVLAGVITDLPLRTRIELAVLRVPAVRYVIVQLVVQPALIGAQLLQAHRAGVGATFAGAIVLVIAVIIAAAAWLLLPRVTPEED